MKKAVFLFIAFFVGCATVPQKYDESYYEVLAEKDAIENTVIDNNTYYGVTLDETIDHKKYIYLGIDDDCRCKKYGKINPNDIFHLVYVYTDMNNKVLKIVLYKEFSDEYNTKKFLSDMQDALKTKYPKLKPMPTGKDIYDSYIVTFTDDKEQYKKRFIQRKKEERYLSGFTLEMLEGRYYRDNEMIHPVLKDIWLSMNKENVTSFFVVIDYTSKKYWEVWRKGHEQRKKEMREKLKGF